MAKKGSGFDIDMDRITVKEYRSIFEDDVQQDVEDTIVAKAAGMAADELLALSQRQYRRLVKAFFKAATEPLDDPN